MLPKEIILCSEVFAVLPLHYSKNSLGKPVLKFSKTLQLWCLISTGILIATACKSLYSFYPTINTFLEQGVSTNIAILFYILPLTAAAVTTSISGIRRYPKFLKMTDVVEKVDKCLGLRIQNPNVKLKMILIFAYATALISYTMVKYKITWGTTSFRINNFIQIALYLQFIYTCKSLAQRFLAINQMFGEEGRRTFLHEVRRTERGPATATAFSRRERSLTQWDILICSYCELHKAVHLAESFHRNQLLSAVANALIQIIAASFFYFQAIISKKPLDMSYFYQQSCWIFYFIFSLAMLLWSISELADAANETGPLISSLINRSLLASDTAVTDKLKLFLIQLCHYKTEFSPLGLFQMDKKLLLSMASSVTTYLLIMLQNRPVEEDTTEPVWRTSELFQNITNSFGSSEMAENFTLTTVEL